MGIENFSIYERPYKHQSNVQTEFVETFLQMQLIVLRHLGTDAGSTIDDLAGFAKASKQDPTKFKRLFNREFIDFLMDIKQKEAPNRKKFADTKLFIDSVEKALVALNDLKSETKKERFVQIKEGKEGAVISFASPEIAKRVHASAPIQIIQKNSSGAEQTQEVTIKKVEVLSQDKLNQLQQQVDALYEGIVDFVDQYNAQQLVQPTVEKEQEKALETHVDRHVQGGMKEKANKGERRDQIEEEVYSKRESKRKRSASSEASDNLEKKRYEEERKLAEDAQEKDKRARSHKKRRVGS